MDFYLSSKAFQHLAIANFPKDFNIIINDHILKCPKFIACFISPLISKHIRTDSTINEIKIMIEEKIKKTEKTENETNHHQKEEEENKKCLKKNIERFGRFLEGEIIHFNQIRNYQNENDSIKKYNKDLSEKGEKDDIEFLFFLEKIGKQLENEEILSFFYKYFVSKDEITKENVIQKMIKKCDYKISNEDEMKFIENHFYEIDIEELEKLKLNELEDILSSKDLKIYDEDSLFETIEKIVAQKKKEFFILFDFVEIQYLTTKNVHKFIKYLEEFIDENQEIKLRPSIWQSICRRLLLNINVKDEINPREIKKKIKCKEGLFKYLTQQTGGNVVDNGTISIETSNIFDGKSSDLFDSSLSTYFRLANIEKGYIKIDFKEHQIQIDEYVFSTPDNTSGLYSGRPKSWSIEGSNDGKEWDEIDSRNDDAKLNCFGGTGIYSCQNKNNFNLYRFIKINEKMSHSGHHYFLLGQLEFKGSIQKSKI